MWLQCRSTKINNLTGNLMAPSEDFMRPSARLVAFATAMALMAVVLTVLPAVAAEDYGPATPSRRMPAASIPVGR